MWFYLSIITGQTGTGLSRSGEFGATRTNVDIPVNTDSGKILKFCEI